MSRDDVRVYFRDSTRRKIGELDDFQSLKVVTPHVGTGSWVLEMNANHRLASFVFEPNHGVIIENETGVLMSGPIRQPYIKDDDTTSKIELSGKDDSCYFAKTNCLPCPPNFDGSLFPYDSAAYDTETGSAESVAKHFVSFSRGPAALSWRQVPGLVIAPDLQRGSAVETQARFDMLDELLAAICLSGGDLGYSVRQGVEGFNFTDLVFDVVVPQDRTASAKFSRSLGNLATCEFSDSEPEFNYLRVAGSGEEEFRAFVEGGDAASIAKWGLLEGSLRDRRDTDEREQLEQTLAEELSKAASKISIKASLSDTEFLQFGVHWGLHDKVTVETYGQSYQEIVREVTQTWSQDAPRRVSVVIGSPQVNAPNIPQFLSAQRALEKRTSQLERRV